METSQATRRRHRHHLLDRQLPLILFRTYVLMLSAQTWERFTNQDKHILKRTNTESIIPQKLRNAATSASGIAEIRTPITPEPGSPARQLTPEPTRAETFPAREKKYALFPSLITCPKRLWWMRASSWGFGHWPSGLMIWPRDKSHCLWRPHATSS